MKLNFAIPVVIGLSVGSLVLQLAGFVTPGWTIVEDGMTTYYGGVWYTVIHYPSITKTWLTSDLSHANNDIRYQVSQGIIGLQTETSVALGLTILATISILFFRKFPQHHVTLMFVIAILVVCHLLSGAVALTAVGTKARHLLDVDKQYVFRVPFSLILTGVGALLNFIAIVFLLLHVRHVLNTLKNQTDRTPFFTISNMRTSRDNRGFEGRKLPKARGFRSDENDRETDAESSGPEKGYKVDGNGKYDQSSANKSKFGHNDRYPETLPEVNYGNDPYLGDEYTHEDMPRKHRKYQHKRGRNHPDVLPQTDYGEAGYDDYGYSREDLQRNPMSDHSSVGRSNPDILPNENIHEHTDRRSENRHKDKPRKLRVKKSRLGNNKHVTTHQAKYEDNMGTSGDYTHRDETGNAEPGQSYPATASYEESTDASYDYSHSNLPRQTRLKHHDQRTSPYERSEHTSYDPTYRVQPRKLNLDHSNMYQSPSPYEENTNTLYDYTHSHPTTSPKIDNPEISYEHTRNDKPRKPKPRQRSKGRNNPQTSPSGYNDNFVATGEPLGDTLEDKQFKIRQSSYYEKLELEAQAHSYYGPASMDPVESSV